MRFLYPLGLIGLIGIPILILIYIIKNKFQEKKIGSVYLWNLSKKFMKRRNPLTEINGLLSLILQLLVITGMAFALAHPIFAIPGTAEKYVLVLDDSASMNITKNGETRFDYAKKEMETLINEGIDGCQYTILLGGKTTTTVVSQEKTKSKILNALEKLTVSEMPSTLDEAISQAQNLYDEDKTLNVIVYTDKTYLKTSENISLVSCDREETNHSLLSFEQEKKTDGTQFTASFYSYGQEESVKIDLFLDDKLIEEKEVTSNKEEKTEVTFTLTDKEYTKAECKIVSEDSLVSDDDIILYQEDKEEEKKVLLVSEKPFYLYSAINLIDNIDLEMIYPSDYDDTKRGYDIYIFDCFAPSELPTDGSLWLVGESENVIDSSYTIQEQVTLDKAGYLSYENLDDITYQKIVKNTNNSSIALGGYYRYTYLADFTTILSLDSLPMLSVRTMSNSYKEIVFSFDLHQSNLPLLYDFPILIKNLLSYSAPEPLESRLYTAGETLEVEKMPNSNSTKVVSPSGKTTYLKLDQGTASLLLEETGSYTLTVYYDNSSVDYSFYVSFPTSESAPHVEEESLSLEGEKETDSLNGELDKLIIVIAAMLLIMVIDWGVYLYEQHQLC